MTQPTTGPSQHQLRSELEAMVLGDLSGPAGGKVEELAEHTVRDGNLVGVLASNRSAGGTAKPAVDEEPGAPTRRSAVPIERIAGRPGYAVRSS